MRDPCKQLKIFQTAKQWNTEGSTVLWGEGPKEAHNPEKREG